MAFEWAAAGHDVYLYDFVSFHANIAAIEQAGGIHSEGKLSGFEKITYAGHDIERVLTGADVVFVVGPAYSTSCFGEVCKPYFSKNQTVIICPGSCGGAIVFKQALGYDLAADDLSIAETHTLPYAVRLVKPGKISVFLRLEDGIYLAAQPAKHTARVMKMIQEVYPYIKPAESVLQTALQNANPVIHPAVSLLNTALIERTGGEFKFYEEGVTPAVGKLIKAIDEERIAIGEKFGFKIIRDPELGVIQGYMQEDSYDRGYNQAPGFKGIKAQDRLDYRYFTEDAGFGLVFWSELGEYAGVDTPAIDAIIHLVSVVMDKSYRTEKQRSIESLGFLKYRRDELMDVL